MGARRCFRARALVKTYHPGEDIEVRALNGVDLDLYAGELVVMLGPSAVGNPPCSTSSAASICRRRARSPIAARI